MKFLIPFFGLLISSNAFAHAGCSGEPFADRFCQLAESSFKVRALPPGKPYSYIVNKATGERLVLDSKYQMAVRYELGMMVERNESETLYSKVGWGEWAKWHARHKLDELKFVFSRRFVLEVAGGAVEGGHRFGRLFPPIYVGAELLEHGVAWVATGYFLNSPLALRVAALPWCGVVLGGCLLFAKKTQELTTAVRRGPEYVNDPNLGWPRNRIEQSSAWVRRFWTWRASKKLRRQIRQGLKSVRRTHNDLDLSERAYNRSFRDFSSGAEIVWGGPFQPGFFRSSLAMPICEECGDVRLKTFKYGKFGGANNPAKPSVPNQIPIIDDLSTDASLAQRYLRAEEYVSFIDTIFSHAALAAGDLIRAKEKGEDGRDVRVPLASTFAKVRGYLSLRRDLGRMRRALDLYSYAIRMRAFETGPRSQQDELLDRDFTSTLGEFIANFNAKLKAVDAFEHRKTDKESFLWTAPRKAYDALADWIRTGQSCADSLEAEPT